MFYVELVYSLPIQRSGGFQKNERDKSLPEAG